MKRIVVAPGGNALLYRGETAEAETTGASVRRAASALVALADDSSSQSRTSTADKQEPEYHRAGAAIP